jgi:hypothetical protein
MGDHVNDDTQRERSEDEKPREPYDKQETDDRGLPKVPRIRLRAPSGIVIDYTLPLHEAIHNQWRNGEMSRVDDDDMPWEGDEYDLDSAYGRDDEAGEDEAADEDRDNLDAEPGEGEADRGDGDSEGPGTEDGDGPEVTYPATGQAGDGGAQHPERPADNAPKRDWQEYAVKIGAVTEDEAGGLTKAQLVEKSTPPEMRPGVQPA